MNDKKDILIIALIIAVVCMGVGYAALSSTLTITGTGRINTSWDVEITNIQKTGGTEGLTEASGTPSYTATTATFDVTFEKPGDEAIYTITIQNLGGLDAKLSTITWNGGTAGSPEYIKYEVTTAPATDSVLAAGGSTTVVVRMYWDSTVTIPDGTTDITQSRTITGTLLYVQNT